MATLSYSYGEGIVWVGDLADQAHPMLHDLCSDHADHLRVPKGWECRDARTVASIGAGAQRRSA